MTEERVDFFISHAGADANYAEWVDQVLRLAGLHTITDLYDFAAGENFVLKMNDALLRADRLLLIWSRHASQRYLLETEWSNTMALHRDRIVPVIVDSSDKPSILAATIHIDLTDVTVASEAERRLLEGLLGRSRPVTPIAYPGASPHEGVPAIEESAQISSTNLEPAGPAASAARERNERSPSSPAPVGTPETMESVSLDAVFKQRTGQRPFAESTIEAQEVWLAAKGFDSFLHDHARTIQQLLARDVSFRFLMHNPENSSVMKTMALMSYSNRDAREVARRLRSATRQIADLQRAWPGKVSLRCVEWPMVNGYTFFDPQRVDAEVYVEFFGFRLSLNERRGIVVSARKNPELYRYHRSNFEDQWEAGSEVTR